MGAYIGLYGGLFAALAHALRGEQAWRKGVALGLGWYLMECFRGWFFTGFPWITLASAFTPWTPVIQLASVIGAYGLGGLLAGLSCLCAEGILRVRHPHALRKRWLPALGGSLAGIFLVVAYGVFSLSFAPSGQGGLWVSLEQGNLDQNVKWEPAMQRLTVKRYLSLSAESLSVPESERPELLIWPETAMPFDYQTAPELSAAIRAFARDRRVALLFGAPGFRNRGDGVVDAFNRAYLIAPNPGWAKDGTTRNILCPSGNTCRRSSICRSCGHCCRAWASSCPASPPGRWSCPPRRSFRRIGGRLFWACSFVMNPSFPSWPASRSPKGPRCW